jgi:hypothetical protein
MAAGKGHVELPTWPEPKTPQLSTCFSDCLGVQIGGALGLLPGIAVAYIWIAGLESAGLQSLVYLTYGALGTAIGGVVGCVAGCWLLAGEEPIAGRAAGEAGFLCRSPEVSMASINYPKVSWGGSVQRESILSAPSESDSNHAMSA